MRGLGSVIIDRDLFQRAFDRRSLTMQEVAAEIGRSRNYLASVKHAGTITPPTMKILETMYGIKPDEYVEDSRKPEVQGTFDFGQVVEELKAIHGTNLQVSNAIEDLTYTLNVIARDLAEIKYSLGIGVEEGGEE